MTRFCGFRLTCVLGESALQKARPIDRIVLLGKGACQTADKGHEERRRHAFVHHIGNDKSDPAVLRQHEGIIEVTRNITRRLKTRTDLPTTDLWQESGQEALLESGARPVDRAPVLMWLHP